MKSMFMSTVVPFVLKTGRIIMSRDQTQPVVHITKFCLGVSRKKIEIRPIRNTIAAEHIVQRANN